MKIMRWWLKSDTHTFRKWTNLFCHLLVSVTIISTSYLIWFCDFSVIKTNEILKFIMIKLVVLYINNVILDLTVLFICSSQLLLEAVTSTIVLVFYRPFGSKDSEEGQSGTEISITSQSPRTHSTQHHPWGKWKWKNGEQRSHRSQTYQVQGTLAYYKVPDLYIYVCSIIIQNCTEL